MRSFWVCWGVMSRHRRGLGTGDWGLGKAGTRGVLPGSSPQGRREPKGTNRSVSPLLCLLLLSCWFSAAAADPPELSGRFEQGGLVTGRVAPGSQVWFNDRLLRVGSDGEFVFGFHRDDPPAAELRVRSLDGREQRYEYVVQQRTYPVQRIDGLPPAMVTPPKDVLERIQAENRRVAQARARDSELTGFAQGFVWPTQGRISSVYGSQRILNNEPRQPHYGLDIAAPTGTPVVAAADGTVRLAETDLYYTGGTIIIDHGHGVSSTYLHLSRLDVEEGQQVSAGQGIGAVGATGRVTGPHLCFRFNWFDSRLDPALLLPPGE
jgi:murein DD-endopeptidase MepM/ murein hydrolase activator NlpD